MKSKNNDCEWHSRCFCDQTRFIVIYSNPGPTPSFFTTQYDSSTRNTSPAGSKKADLCRLLFFLTREKSQQSPCLEILSVFPSLALFFIFLFFNSTYLCRWPARTCLFATTILLCHWAISCFFFPCWGMRRGEGRFISNATLSVWQEREALKVMLHRYIRQQHHIGVFCWVRRGRSEDRL